MIKEFLKKFFKQVEETPVLPLSEDELVEGQAFKIKHYSLSCSKYFSPKDLLTITIYDTESNEEFKVQEEIESSIYVDTVSTIRFNDALGYKHAIGAIFGQKNKEKV